MNIDEYTGYIYLNPKTGYHDTTVIFLDSTLRENNQFLKAFAEGKLTSNNTRIIFPQGEVTGQIEKRRRKLSKRRIPTRNIKSETQ